MTLRISEIGDFRIIGKANTLNAQLRNIAARHSFINQSEEAHLIPVQVPVSQFKGGVRPSIGPAALPQDIDQFAPGYVRGLSKGVL